MPGKPCEFALATKAYERWKWQECVDLFTRAESNGAKYMSAQHWMQKGHAYFKLKDYSAAIVASSKCLAVGNDKQALNTRSECYVLLNMWNEALSDCNCFLRAYGDHWNILDLRANCLVQLGRVDAALADYLHAVELQPSAPTTHSSIARIYELREDYKNAAKHLNKALLLFTLPNHVRECQEQLDQVEKKLSSKRKRELVDEKDQLPLKKSKPEIVQEKSKPEIVQEKWSAVDVAKWIGAIAPAYLPYSDAILANGVDGATFLQLSDGPTMDQLGIKNVLHRTRILTSIAKMKNPDVDSAGQSSLCCACLDAPRCMMFEPCYHLSVCETCAKSNLLLKCPQCRTDITKRIKLFL